MRKRELVQLERLNSDRLMLTEALSILEKLEDEVAVLIKVIENPKTRFPVDDLETYSWAIDRIRKIGNNLRYSKNKRKVAIEMKSFGVEHALSCQQLRDALNKALSSAAMDIQVLESN